MINILAPYRNVEDWLKDQFNASTSYSYSTQEINQETAWDLKTKLEARFQSITLLLQKIVCKIEDLDKEIIDIRDYVKELRQKSNNSGD